MFLFKIYFLPGSAGAIFFAGRSWVSSFLTLLRIVDFLRDFAGGGLVQGSAVAIEREARHRLPPSLPRLLAELLDESVVQVETPRDDARQADFIATDGQGRVLMMEVKNSSRPGQVARAAEQLLAYADEGVIPVLVVPFMSRAGAETADRMRLNWIDLSGNAHVRAENLHLWVLGRPNELGSRGRPSSPFAPKSARVTRALLLDAARWWVQKDLAAVTSLDDGNVSRIVRRLDDEFLLERRDRELRPRDPDLARGLQRDSRLPAAADPRRCHWWPGPQP